MKRKLRHKVRSGVGWGLLISLLLGSGIYFSLRSSAFWDALSPVTRKKVLYRLAGRVKVDPLLLAAIVRVESGFYPYAESHAGALGLMQLRPETAEALAKDLKLDYSESEDLYREDLNLTLGAHYFARQLKAFDGNLVLALAAYNAGPTKTRSWHLEAWGRDQEELITAIPVSETRNYVRKVLKTYRFFKLLQEAKRVLAGDEAL